MQTNINIDPSSGQGSVNSENKTIAALPMNSLLDSGTFEMNLLKKLHIMALPLEIKKKYVQTRFFSRKIQSLISNLDIKCGGRSFQNITKYSYIFNVLNDCVCGTDANKLEKMLIHKIKALR